jgi:hypothetical protein
MRFASVSGRNRGAFRVDDFVKPQVAALRPPLGIIDAKMGRFWARLDEKTVFLFTVLCFSPRLPAVSTQNSPTRLLFTSSNYTDSPRLPRMTTSAAIPQQRSRFHTHRVRRAGRHHAQRCAWIRTTATSTSHEGNGPPIGYDIASACHGSHP